MNFSTTSRNWRVTDSVRKRLLIGMAFSLLVHGFILSLEFGLRGLGLPGLSAPWSERRAQTPALDIVLVPPRGAPVAPPAATPQLPAPLPPELPPLAVTGKGLRLVPPRIPAPTPAPAKSRPTPAKRPKLQPAQIKSQPKLIASTEPRKDAFTVAPPDPDIPAESATSVIETPEPPIEIAETPSPEKAPVKPEEPPPPVDTQTQIAQKRAEEEALSRAREAETKRQEEEAAKRLEQEREATRLAEQAAKEREAALTVQREQEAAAKRALELEQRRLAELKRQEEEKAVQEKAAREAAELAVRKQAEELARQRQIEELARQKQAEELAAKAREQELARQRAEAAAAEQRRIVEETGRAAAAAAAARLAGNDGRQGGASASQRDLLGGGSDLASRALEQARRPDLLRIGPQRPATGEPERSQRRSVLGNLDRDVGLAMYIKSWSLKIERNGNLNYSQLSKDRARSDPVVTVAIRSDGSVEDIIIHRSSGRPDLDEAVSRIVRLNARYAVFPPELARKYDVIEIRRIWSFDDTLRLIEEVR